MAVILFSVIGTAAAMPPYPYYAAPNTPAAVQEVWQDVSDWMFLSITGSDSFEPGDSINHGISISTPETPDLDWSDGEYVPFYGGWALLDTSGNILVESGWSMLAGNQYQATATFDAPAAFGDYALTALIVKVPQTYNTATKTWTVGTQEIMTREAALLSVTILTVPGAEYPSFLELLNNFWSWLLGLFGL